MTEILKRVGKKIASEVKKTGIINCWCEPTNGPFTGRHLKPSASYRERRFLVEYLGMTAIVSVCTSDGFIIGADGLRTDWSGVVTSEAQKIFPIQRGGMVAGFAWAGHSRLEYADRPYFDFIEQSQQIIADLEVDYLGEYGEKFAKIFNARLLLHNGGDNIQPRGRTPNEIARVIFVGYGKNRAERVEIVFSCEHGITYSHITAVEPQESEFEVFNGSKVVLDAMEPADYVSLDDAAESVRDYIQKCADNKIDPYCRSIGGRIHIAAITPDSFRWIIPPIV